jgi:drug/metabolite transporter (DMT)-like permease
VVDFFSSQPKMSAVFGGILFLLGIAALAVGIYYLVTRGSSPEDAVPWWAWLLLIGGIILILLGGGLWFYSSRTITASQAVVPV